MNDDNFNAGNVPPNPFSNTAEPTRTTRSDVQRVVAGFTDPEISGNQRVTNDPSTGEPIIIDDLTYLTLEHEYPEYMANRSAARLEDQDTITSLNSMGKEDDYQAAVDGRIRSTYRYSTNSWLDKFDFISPLDREMFTADTMSESQFDAEVLRLSDNGFMTYFLGGGSKQLGDAQDIPTTELMYMNLVGDSNARDGMIASPEAIVRAYGLALGDRAEGNDILERAMQGDEEALVEARDYIKNYHINYRERDNAVAERLRDLDHTNHPELEGYIDDLRTSRDGYDREVDRRLVENFAQAQAIRRFGNQTAYAAHDFLDATKTPEERTAALSLIKLGAQVYGPDFVQQTFTSVAEKDFDINNAWATMDAPTAKMAKHLGVSLEMLVERGFNPKNSVTFTYQVQQELNRRIGADERTTRIMRDYDWEITQTVARLGYDFYRGVADDPVAMGEILPGIISGMGVGAGAARMGLSGVSALALEATAGGLEASVQTMYTSESAQQDQISKGLRTEVSTGQMVQDTIFIASLSVGLESVFTGIGYGLGKTLDGSKDASGMIARSGLLGENAKHTAIARELMQTLSNDDVAGIRLAAPNLTQQQQVLLQTREVNAVEATKVALEAKVTDAGTTDTLNDLLSPSVLDAQGISQLEAANFVQGVLRDLGTEETMDAKTLGELWTAYTIQRKEALAKPMTPAAKPDAPAFEPKPVAVSDKMRGKMAEKGVDTDGVLASASDELGARSFDVSAKKPEISVDGEKYQWDTRQGETSTDADIDRLTEQVPTERLEAIRDAGVVDSNNDNFVFVGSAGGWSPDGSFKRNLVDLSPDELDALIARRKAAKTPEGPAAKTDRATRLHDELLNEANTAADDLLFDSRITKEPSTDQIDEVVDIMSRVEDGAEVTPAELMKVVDASARTRSRSVQNMFREFFNTDRVKALVGEDNVNRVNKRLDAVVENTQAARDADPDLDVAVRVASFFERANNETSIRARSEVGYTKKEIIAGITAYIRTAGNATARAALEARWGKGKLQGLIKQLGTNVDDVLERTSVQAYDLGAFKRSDAYKDIRNRRAARSKLAANVRRANKMDSPTDRKKAIAKASKAYKKEISKLNEDATTKIDADTDVTIEEIQATLKTFQTMTPIERRFAMSAGFTRLIDKVDPEAVSNAPVANDVKGMNRLFAGTNLGDSLERAWAGIALWPVSQSKLFRSRTRIVRGLANFIGNRHIGTTRYGDINGSTVEGAVNAAKRQIAPIMGALRAIRSKMDRTSFGQFQSGLMRMRMTGQMAMLRKATPEQRAELLGKLPSNIVDAYKDRPQDLFNDLLAVDEMLTNYSRQVLEEARFAGLMRLDPDGNPEMKIDPSRYVPNNLNPNLSATQRTRLVDNITELAKKQAMESGSALNTDVMVGLGWIRAVSESTRMDPNTGRPAAKVEYEVPEDSVFSGITGKGAKEDAEFVLKNARRGRAWLEEMAGSVRARAAATEAKPTVVHRANTGSVDNPRPTSARGTAHAADEAFYVNGFDPAIAALQKKAHAMRLIDMTNMSPEQLVRHLRDYEEIQSDLIIREAELAEQYTSQDLTTPNGTPVRRPNVSADEVSRLAKDDDAFADISPGHAEQLSRLDTLVKNGTITTQHKRMLMAVFAPLDLNRAVGLGMHTRSPLDLKLRQLWEYEAQVREDLEADGVFDMDEVVAEVNEDIRSDASILDEMDDDAETFGTTVSSEGGSVIDFQRGLKDNQNVNAATTVLHEMNHVLFFNSSGELQAAAQHMFNELRRGGIDSATGRLMMANGMTREEVRYAMTNVHEFVAHMGELVLGGNVIKISRRGGEKFFVGLMNSIKDLLERLFFRPDMDRQAGKAGFNQETWSDVKELITSIYSGVNEQIRIADVIRTRYTSFEDNLTMRFGTDVDIPGSVVAKKSGLDEAAYREEVLRAVRLQDPDFGDMPLEEQKRIVDGYVGDKGLVKDLFDIDPPVADKSGLPPFEVDPSLGRPEYSSIENNLSASKEKLEQFDAMRLAMLTDEDGNPRVMSDIEEAQYRQVDEAVEALRSRIASDEFTLSTSQMTDEGYQRLLYVLDHTDGNITESYIKNIIRNDGVHIPTTSGNAGIVTDSLKDIVKKAKLDFKQSSKQTAAKMGASGSGADSPSASEISISETAADPITDVTSINSAEGVEELVNTINTMAHSFKDNLSPEDKRILEVGIIMLEKVMARAHRENWPIGSTVLDEFQYQPEAALRKMVLKTQKDEFGNPLVDENNNVIKEYEEVEMGVDARKKLIKENSLHPYTWSKLSKETQKAIKAEFKGILKASELSSPKPVLNALFALLKREANTEDLARHFGETKKTVDVPEDENSGGKAFVEAAEDALEAERNLVDVKNTDSRTPIERQEDVVDEMIAKNPLVDSVTAANAADEVGQVAPGHPMAVAKLIDEAEKAGSLQELHDNVNLFAGQDYRNEVLVTEAAVLMFHAGRWNGDEPPFPGLHVGSAFQAMDRAAQLINSNQLDADRTYMTSAVLPKGSRFVRVADTGGHDRVGMFISSVVGNNPALIQEGARRGIDFQKKLQEFIENDVVDYEGLGRFLKEEFDMDGFVYSNNAEGSASPTTVTRDGKDTLVNPQNDSFIVLNPDVLVDRASSPLLESKVAVETFRADANEVRNPYTYEDSPVVNDDIDESSSFWEVDNLESWTGPDGFDRQFSDEELGIEPDPDDLEVEEPSAPAVDPYTFVDQENSTQMRLYAFTNAAGENMTLDINRTTTADGDEAIGVAFHRDADMEADGAVYAQKTGAGDARRMLTAIMEIAFKDADEMGVDNVQFTRTRGDGDRAYGMLLKRGLRDNPNWHVRVVDAGLSETEWVVSRGPAPEGGPEIRGIKPEDAELEQNLITALTEQTQMLAEGKPIIPQVAAALIADANELVERVADLDNLATSVMKLQREMRRYDFDMKAKADKEAREAAGEVDDRPVFGEEPKAEEPKADDAGGGDKPPADTPTAKGPDEEPEDSAKAFREAFMAKYSDKAVDDMLNAGKDVSVDSIPGKLNPSGKHSGQNLSAIYDEGVNGVGTTDVNGNSVDPIQERSKQYVDTNVTDTAAVRSNNADGQDLDVLVGRTSGTIDETMSRRFSDEDFESEIGQEIAAIFADNMDLASNLMNYARGTGARVKIQAMLNEAFGKGVNMSLLFKEAHDSMVELIQTDSKNGKLTANKSKAALAEAEETIKQMKLMFLHTMGMNVTMFDRAGGVGKATNIAKNLAYSKLGGGFSQMVALVEAPFATLRTGGMGPMQILRNMQSFLGGIFMAGAGVVGRNVPGMGRLASEYGIDKTGARFLSEDLVTFMDNFDGTSAMARFGFTGDQGNMAAFTFRDRAIAQADRVKQASSGESRGPDEGWLGATVEAGTGAIADMTGVMSGMEQVTDIARSIGVNIGRTSLSKFGGKLIKLAEQIGDGNKVDKKTFLAAARKLGIPRAIAIRANHAGLLAEGGLALKQLERVGGVRYGTSNAKQIDLNVFNDRIQQNHTDLRGQGFLDDTVGEQIRADGKAVEAVQEFLLGFGRQSSPELKGSLAMSRADPITQFMFSFLSYPMAAYQELVTNGFKANGVASTAGILALLGAFEFNARMVRAMNDGDEDERKKAQEIWTKAFSGGLTMEQYLYTFANYGTQSPAFGHFGGWMGDILNTGLDSMLPVDQANPVSDLRKKFKQSPFASPVVGTVQSIAGSLSRGATAAGQAVMGTGQQATSMHKYKQKQNSLARDLGTAIDVFTPFNSGGIQALSQITTGHKLGDALGNAAFVGSKAAGLNSSGATPPGMWEARKNRGYNQVNQYANPADAPDYQKRLQEQIMAKPPAPWMSEAEKAPSAPAQPAAPAPAAPSSPSSGLADSLPGK